MGYRYFNPLNELYEKESPRRPHARTLREGWLTKTKDTFWVLAGNKEHVGLLDWSTLFIPLLISKIWTWCSGTLFSRNTKPKDFPTKTPSWGESLLSFGSVCLALLLFIPVGLMHLICFVLRYSFAAIITLLASVTINPFIQLITWGVSYSPKQKIGKLIDESPLLPKGENIKASERSFFTMLGGLLTNTHDLSRIQVEYVSAPDSDDLENISVLNLSQVNETNLNFNSDFMFWDGESPYKQKLLYVFSEGIVYVDRTNVSNGCLRPGTNYQKRFKKSADLDGLLKLGNDNEIFKAIRKNPQTYMLPHLIFTSTGENDESEEIAYVQTNDLASNNGKREAIGAMLGLNVGGLSYLFDGIPDQNFKNHFPDESSNPKLK